MKKSSNHRVNPVRNYSGASNPAGTILEPNPAVGGTAEQVNGESRGKP